jgi:hypothetical protein
MPWNDDPTMQALRLTYNAAVAAHADRARAITDATLCGETPSPAAIEAEAKARLQLAAAREKLHAAMARAMSSVG